MARLSINNPIETIFLSPERLAVFCAPNALTVLTWSTDDEREVSFKQMHFKHRA